jgi:hypothetical protein
MHHIRILVMCMYIFRTYEGEWEPLTLYRRLQKLGRLRPEPNLERLHNYKESH